ncbi:PAS domain-containing protein [Actinoplanes sp. NPDC049265]|uniref:PAS domain-containing protein n=1 Tax=Actinoplanes sp. NPDC049265 TaxID=3363902 RepID=UPI003721E627
MLSALEWIILGAGSAAAIAIGVCRHRPARIGPWFLLAGSVLLLAIGDAALALDHGQLAEVCYYGMFALVACGLLQFTRGGAILVDRARLIDLLAFSCAALLVVWVFVIGGTGQIGQISAADVIGDLLLIVVSVRLLMATGRNVAAILLLVGAVGMLGSDIAWGLAENWWTESGYRVLYLAWGASALHPSMSRLTVPMPTRPSPWRGHWAALLGISVATPPAVLMIEALSGDVTDGLLIAIAGAITLTLTITRLADSVAQNSRALLRERTLREASAALVAAAGPDEVDRAVRAAIDGLMPAAALHKVVFAMDDRQLTMEAVPPAGTDPRGRSWWVQDSDNDDATLVCPLWLEPLAVARPSGGALVVAGHREDLTATQDALEVLAGQAALALDRITLVEAVGRRDSDLYLRAVVRNTAELMLVIDEDQRIRYASPALRDLIGVDELPPLATLTELVHPDDRTQVRQALQDDGDGVLFCSLRRPDERQVLVEATYRDLRDDRLVQGYVVTMRHVPTGHEPDERLPHIDHVDELPAWVNRRSAQHKFRY